MPTPLPPLRTAPLTPARWPDLEDLFLARGCAQARTCWCMYYRRSGEPVVPAGQRRADLNHDAFQALVDTSHFTGLLAYEGSLPVGWLSFGPREDFAKLARSPVMKPVDDLPVWSLICFVVRPTHRGRGVARALLAAAVQEARQRGVTLEAYPVDKPGPLEDDTLWFGPASLYTEAGFTEVARRKPERPVVRLTPV
ncbi:GNAT family N-acetyltransferase [Ideonella sp. B7]|uniref:GNAT family N-acetyltransferase n=1 Tax=Ideonella benzenivorans TaxID=2831643 RepID=UPI001CEC295C|nr:GNAT family N-acetyltransferase [Ideonella benzenivorans]MCA6216205.1 GNAT family N-acetyltransferase [Ideonella benzenivorans]